MTAGLAPSQLPVPRPRGGAHAARRRRAGAAPVRERAARVTACLTLTAVVPLCLLAIPNGMGWFLPGTLASSPAAAVNALRASGMALPAMMAAAPIGSVLLRRLGAAWPVLLAGLLAIALGDMLGQTANSVALIAVDRAIHGAGAGLALPAALAQADSTARLAHPDGYNRQNGPFWRSGAMGLGVIWAFVTVASLLAAPVLVRERMAAGDWRAVLQPYPWLTGVALGCAAVYPPLAGRAGLRRRDDLGDRSQVPLVAAPIVALALMVVAVSYQSRAAVAAAAIAEVLVLATLAAKLGRSGAGRGAAADRFPAVCVVTGFTLMPAAALAPEARGLVPLPAVAAVLAVLALVLATALVRSLRRTTVAGLLTGVPLMVAAVGAGYLAAAVHG